VTGSGLSLAGADAGNYTVNSTATTQADITPAPLGQPVPVVVPVVLAAGTVQTMAQLSGDMLFDVIQGDKANSSPLIQNSVGSGFGLAGLNLNVIGAGVRMPPIPLAETPAERQRREEEDRKRK
jgi:hypothetical protein